MEREPTLDKAYCARCQQDKLQTDFYRNRSTSSGWQAYCKRCCNAYNAEWCKRNPEAKKRFALTHYHKHKVRYLAAKHAQHLAHPELKHQHLAARRAKAPKLCWAKNAILNARVRARRLGVPLDMTVEYLLSICPDVCPALGLALAYPNGTCGTKHGGSANSPTVDRIDNRRGYVVGNVAVISFRANAIKQDATADEISAVADWVRIHANGPG